MHRHLIPNWTSRLPGAFDLDPNETAWLVGTTHSPELTQHDLQIHTQRDFDQLNLGITGFLCAYIGILTMIALTTLVFGIALKDPVTLWYGIFFVCMSGVAFDSYGVLDAFFTVPFPFGANSFGRALPPLSVVPSTIFISIFLETKKHLPRVHRLFMINAAAALTIGLVRFFPSTHSYSLVLGDIVLLVALITSLTTCFVLSIRGVPFARHFAVAYSCLVSAIMICLSQISALERGFGGGLSRFHSDTSWNWRFFHTP